MLVLKTLPRIANAFGGPSFLNGVGALLYRHAYQMERPENQALRVNVGFGVAGTGWRVMLAGVLGLGSWWGW